MAQNWMMVTLKCDNCPQDGVEEARGAEMLIKYPIVGQLMMEATIYTRAQSHECSTAREYFYIVTSARSTRF